MIEVVCGVIRDDQGRYLACLRPPSKHLGGFWEFPGGKIEPGELPEDALLRELREELSIEVEVGRRLEDVVWDYGTGPIRLMPFLCRILAGEPQPVEHEELRWCIPDDFHAIAWAPADQPVLKEISGF